MDLILFFAAFAAVAYFGYKHWKKTQAKPGPGAPKNGKELPQDNKK